MQNRLVYGDIRDIFISKKTNPTASINTVKTTTLPLISAFRKVYHPSITTGKYFLTTKYNMFESKLFL